MTAESTVPGPAGQPYDLGRPPVSVLPPRPAPGPALPAGRPAAPPAAAPPLAADGAAALVTALALPGLPGRPLCAALLVAVSLLLAPRRARRLPAVLDELPAVGGRIAVAWLTLAALAAACDPRYALSAPVLLAGFAAQTALACAGRGALYRRRRAALLRHPHAALVVGPAATARRVAAAVLRHPRYGLRPVGIVAADADGTEPLPVLATDEEVLRAVVQNGVRDVLAVHPAARVRHAALLRTLAAAGCAVWELDPDSPAAPGPEVIAGYTGRRLAPGPDRRGAAKRALDVVVSGALLVLAGPLLLVCAAVLRVSGGPGVVFRQERIGQGGRPFTLLKFRTHRPADAHESATRWSVADEHRMTWFCRFLRRTSLDELLQLWNVFRGDMSLVGPRPERPYFVAQFSQAHPGYAARHRMPAGITGLAQIHGLRGDTSIEDRARFDNAYIDTWSLWQDVCILLRTAATLVRPTGS
ncbi:exopolysaccharide biosynthesis polyprenyl glycosylphosphotransferase [Streptomyces fumanus]|uniref:Transferase n=1 Tax=Streptomyces fumanus TaxID=67302 RepID=A0A919A380_9ACTN|nr:exopolysaccharide biosynthesis polyprenyl glycosylphosphotransferase [Streptomyces fumanus]GHE85431.1 transferase [Streptomyces fumanus]